jgi:hypothetical protein
MMVSLGVSRRGRLAGDDMWGQGDFPPASNNVLEPRPPVQHLDGTLSAAGSCSFATALLACYVVLCLGLESSRCFAPGAAQRRPSVRPSMLQGERCFRLASRPLAREPSPYCFVQLS